MLRICVFCGSSPGTRPAYRAAAVALGAELAGRGVGLIYGGGRCGLMGTVADAALAGGGEVVGVIPRLLMDSENAHQGLSQLEVVETLHARKARMTELSDAFVALPGGFGTFEELLEAIAWRQVGIHQKPIGLLDAEGFFGPFVALADQVIREGFAIMPEPPYLLAASAADLVDRLLIRLTLAS